MPGFSHDLAIIIGIDQYENGVPPLHTAVNDARELDRILKEQHKYQSRLWLDQQATLAALTHLFEDVLPKTVMADDRLLFYFAGHGIALNGEDGPEGYLIPQDARLGNISSYLPMTQLNQALAALPCRHFLGILDCCFAGAFRWSSNRDVSTIPEIIHKERFDRFIQDPAWQVITSAAYDQRALDFLSSQDRGSHNLHSPFANALINALTGQAGSSPPTRDSKPMRDGIITATELYIYLRDEVERSTEDLTKRQTPGLWCLKKHDKGEYIFLIGDESNLLPAPPLDASKNPYRGLASFEEKHHELFFGRTELTKRLQEFVDQHSLTVVLGASGSGKSSLVKAGLLPKLRQLEGDHSWLILSPFRPGESPFKSLNSTLKTANLPGIAVLGEALGLPNPLQSLANWFDDHSHTNLLLVIDQFEELITLCHDEQERQHFIEILADAIKAYPNQFHLLLTLRSDFEPQFRNTALEEHWTAARFVVSAMTREELREAIEEPASLRVMHFEPHNLVDQLIDEVVQMPGALPLLSFALSELYLKYLQRQKEARDRGETIDRAITQADYEKLGEVTRALTQRADQEYDALVRQDSKYAQTIRHVMLRMVSVEGDLARRRVPLSELEYLEPENTRVKTVIKSFLEARLLTSGTNIENQPYVEPAHDALVRGWQRLLDWQQQDLANLILQRELTPTADKWVKDKKNGQAIGLLWNGDPRLPRLEQIRKSESGNWLNVIETEFVDRSVQRRRNNRNRLVVSVITAFLSVSTAAVIAFWQQNMAIRREISTLIASSETRLLVHDQLGALIDSVKAGQRLEELNSVLNGLMQVMYSSNNWVEIQAKSTTTLHRVLSTIREQNRLEQHSQAVNHVAFTPQCSANEPLLASASADHTVKLWTLNGVELVKQPLSHGAEVSSVSFSQDCQLLVSASHDGTIKIWRRNGELFKELLVEELPGIDPGVDVRITDVSFSPSGQTIAAVIDYPSEGYKGHIGLWRRDGTPLMALSAETYQNSRISFSRNGMMALGSHDKVILWKLRGELPQKLQEVGNQEVTDIWSVDISPDGTMLAASDNDGTVKLWDIDGKLLDEWKADDELVRDLRFSPSGQMLASAGEDSILKLWCIESVCPKGAEGEPVRTFEGHGEKLNSVDFSSDGNMIATASSDYTIKLWYLSDNNDVAQHWNIGSCQNPKARFSRDTHVLAWCDNHATELWSLDTENKGEEVKKLGDRSLNIEDDINNLEGEVIAAIDEEKGAIIRYDSNGHFLNTLNQLSSEIRDGSIKKIKSSPDGKIIAVVSKKNGTYSVRLWNVEENSFTPLETDGKSIIGIRFSPNGRVLALAGEDNKILLWNLEDYQNPKSQPPLNGMINGDRTFRFSPDSRFLAFLEPASDEKHILLWSAYTQKLLSPLEGHDQLVTEISFSPDSNVLASGSLDNTVRVWSLDGRKTQVLTGHSSWIRKVIFHPNLPILASFDESREIRLWSFEGELISVLGNNQNNLLEILDMRFTQDGKLIFAEIASDRFRKESITQVTSLDLKQEHLMQSGCRWLKNYLDNNQNISEEDKTICRRHLE